jgi:hypothetical protein
MKENIKANKRKNNKKQGIEEKIREIFYKSRKHF